MYVVWFYLIEVEKAGRGGKDTMTEPDYVIWILDALILLGVVYAMKLFRDMRNYLKEIAEKHV